MYDVDLLTWPRRAAVILAALLALTVVSSAAAAPARVVRAENSTVKVERPKLHAAAFAIDDNGGFLTTEQAASRGADIRVVFPDGKALPAKREESDAPAGLAIIRVAGGPKLRPLSFSRQRLLLGQRAWIVSPGRRPRETTRRPKSDGIENSAGLAYLPAGDVSGTTGSPVVDRRGHVVAVLRADRFTSDTYRGQQVLEAVTTNKRPASLPAIKPPEKNDFPAIPVVIGLGILLLLANIFFSMRRRREVAAVAQAAGTPPDADHQAGGAQVAAPTKPEPDDDLEISLKSKPNGAGKPGKPAKPGKLTVDPDAAPAPRGDEDPDELVTLKGR